MQLNDKEKYRYSRHLLLDKVGEKGQLKLKSAKVLVIGAGGLGCPVLLYLTAAGVGEIGIIDFDEVDETNLQRQVLFTTEDVGKNKALTAKHALEKRNPYIQIDAYNYALTNQNAIALFEKYDIVVDGTDNFSTRYMVNDACVLTNTPLVYGAIHKFEGQVAVFNYKEGPTYRCLFPEPPKAGSVPSCSEVGVIGVLPGIIGSLQANEAIKIILDSGESLAGKLLLFDALKTSFMEVKISKSFDLEKFGISNPSDFSAFNYDFYCGINNDSSSSISKEEFDKLPDTTIVVDVREDWEQPKISGKKVINAPLDDLDEYIEDLPKDLPVYVVCQRGARSKAAIEYLRKEYNFVNLINVTGGMLG